MWLHPSDGCAILRHKDCVQPPVAECFVSVKDNRREPFDDLSDLDLVHVLLRSTDRHATNGFSVWVTPCAMTANLTRIILTEHDMLLYYIFIVSLFIISLLYLSSQWIQYNVTTQ